VVTEHDSVFEVIHALQSQHACARIHHGPPYPTLQSLPYSDRAAVVVYTQLHDLLSGVKTDPLNPIQCNIPNMESPRK
jgi:hypothetical protein